MNNTISPVTRYAAICIAIAAWLTPILHADATIEYKFEIKPNSGFPTAYRDGLKAIEGRRAPVSLRVKGHAGYAVEGDRATIIDFERKEVTRIDNVHKTIVIVSPACTTEEAAAKPESGERRLPSGYTIKQESRVTGHTAVIHGVQADEREVTILIFLPAASQKDPDIRLVVRVWTATAAAVAGVPALRELAAFGTCRHEIPPNFGGVQEVMLTLLNTLKIGYRQGHVDPNLVPLVNSGLWYAFSEIWNNPVVVMRVHADAFFNFDMDRILNRSSWQPSERFHVAQVDQVVSELSDAPIDSALFEPPKGFAARTAGLITLMIGKPLPVSRWERPRTSTPPAETPLPPRLIRVAGDAQATRLMAHPGPIYPAEARAAQLSGHVILNAIIDRDGAVRELSAGGVGNIFLIPAAIDAVKQWTYQPTLVNGEPVEVFTTIDVNFVMPE